MAMSASAMAVTVLDRHESELVEQAMAAVQARTPSDASILQGLLVELKATSELLDRQRPLRRPTALGGEARDETTLIDHLCTIDGLSGDLALPLKATLSRTYLLTKINFLRGFVKATAALGDVAGCVRMTHELREEVAQSIYTQLAEELFLESAWHARNRINSAYGTLLGATETFRLVTEDCSPDVIEFFGREGMSADESTAFEEFLFNMTCEELATLRRAMQQQHIGAASPAWAAEILGRQIEELEHSHEIDPMALYRSYQRRQLAADFRLMSGAPGPRRTAEGYLMVYLLDQQ
jgi:hypothetical protein